MVCMGILRVIVLSAMNFYISTEAMYLSRRYFPPLFLQNPKSTDPAHKTKIISTTATTTYRIIITHPYHYQQLRLSSLLLSILNAHHKLWSIICNIPRLPQKILLDRDKLKIVSSEVNKIHQVDFNTTTAFNTVIIFCIEFCGSGTVRSIPYWCK